MIERFELREIGGKIFRFDNDSGELCMACEKEIPGDTFTPKRYEYTFVRVAEPPEIVEDETEEGEEDEEDDAK